VADALYELVAEQLRAVDPDELARRSGELSFIGLGGDSLGALQIATRAAERLDTRLPFAQLLSDRPLSEVLAGATAQAAAGDGGSLEEVSGEPTPGQRGMWAAEQAVGGQLYGLVFTAYLSGPLSPISMERAVRRTVARHEGLRTTFDWSTGSLRRLIGPEPDGVFQTHTMPGGPAAEPRFWSWAREYADSAARRPIDLRAGPTTRFLLLAGGAESHALVLITHHLVLDAWAIGLVFDELFAHYRYLAGGPRPEPADPVPAGEQVLHHNRLERAGRLAEQREFWRNRLAAVPSVVEVPTERPRPAVQQPAGRRLPFALEDAEAAAVDRRAAEVGVTAFVLLLAAFGRTIARASGMTRLLVGVPASGRATEPLRRLVAQCARVVPVVLEVVEDPVELLRATQRSLASSLDNADLPLEVLAPQYAAGDLSRNPLVQVVCGSYSHLIDWARELGPLTVRIVEGHAGGSPMDLTIAFQGRRTGYSGTLEFATGVWTSREAREFLDSYRRGIAELAAQPVTPPCTTRLDQL
jgi:acyl carrier protein